MKCTFFAAKCLSLSSTATSVFEPPAEIASRTTEGKAQRRLKLPILCCREAWCVYSKLLDCSEFELQELGLSRERLERKVRQYERVCGAS